MGANYALDCHDDPDTITPDGNNPRPHPIFPGYHLYAAIAMSQNADKAAIVWQSEVLAQARSAAIAR